MASQEIYDKVSEYYSAASQTKGPVYGSTVAKSFGYSEAELADAPEGSNLGLSCGNPFALATITEVCNPHCFPAKSDYGRNPGRGRD